MLTFTIVEKAIFTLAGFVVGVLAGRYVPVGITKKTATKNVPRGEGVEMYVGNLAYTVSKRDIEKAFGACGQVVDVRIIRNKMNGKSKGYGFVEMADSKGSHAAVRNLNGKDLKGRPVVVKEARSRERD